MTNIILDTVYSSGTENRAFTFDAMTERTYVHAPYTVPVAIQLPSIKNQNLIFQPLHLCKIQIDSRILYLLSDFAALNVPLVLRMDKILKLFGLGNDVAHGDLSHTNRYHDNHAH